MKNTLAISKILFIILLTTVIEFMVPDWAPFIIVPLVLLLTFNLWREKQLHWLYIFSLVLVIFPELQVQFIGPLEIHHAFLLILALQVGINWLRAKNKTLDLLTILILLFIGFSLFLTWLNSAEIDNWHRVFTLLFMFLITLLAPYVVQRLRTLKQLGATLLWSTIVTALIGVAALYTAVLTESYFSSPFLHISIVEGVPRLAGTLLDSNFLGLLLINVIPIAIALTFSKIFSSRTKLFLMGSSLFLLGVLFLTYSRSAYIGIAVALVLLLFNLKLPALKIRCKKIALIVLGGLLFAVLMYPPFIFFSIYRTPTVVLPVAVKQNLLTNFNATKIVDDYRAKIADDPTLSEAERDNLLARDVSSDSLGYRLSFWRAGLQMFKDKPITGHGVGQFRFNYANYSSSKFLVEPDAHNIYIELLAEVGIVGFLLFIAIIVIAFRNLKRTLHSSNQLVALFAAGLIAALGGLLVQSALLGGLGAISIYLILGLAIALPNISRSEK